VDGSQKIAGERMGYDFEHRSGAVINGATTMEGFYYVGREIKRFADGSLKIRGGRMTSCDLAHPHYHFWADKMMITPGDKVVARPIVMKIGHVPVFALPFYFKSLKAGRKSGILFPSFNFGWSQRTGRYIRDWGYYWATNDYTDFTFRGDFNERRELTWEITNRYVKRYAFNGRASYSRRTTLGDGPRTREWQLRWSHQQQTLFDYYRFRANLRMSSRSISRSDLINDVGRDVISGQQTSTIYLSRSWSALSASLNFKRDEFVNKQDDDPATNNKLSSQSFPQLSLSFKSRPLLPARHGAGRGSFLGDLLRNTYLRQSYSFRAQHDRFETTAAATYAAAGNASLDFKAPRIWIFNLSTGVSGSQAWTRHTESGETFAWDEADSAYTATPLDLVEEETRTSLSINSKLTTTLYGTFSPHVGRLRAIRHTVRLGVSHRLSPAIGGKQPRSESFGLSLDNRFDVKYRSGAEGDSTAQLRKLDGVLDWNLTTSYNPDRPHDQRWSTINSSTTISPGRNRNLRLNLNNTVDPYRWKVLSTRLTYGLSLQGKVDTGGEPTRQQRQLNPAIDRLGPALTDTAAVDTAAVDSTAIWSDLEQQEQLPGGGDFAGFGRLGQAGGEQRGRDDTANGRYIPWRLGSNLSYNRNNITGGVTARASLSMSVTLTPHWNLSWRGSYDFERGTLISQSWNVQRDLHCWQLRFTRTISAVDSQFGFILSLKAIPDIKLTRGKQDLVGGLRRLGGGIF